MLENKNLWVGLLIGFGACHFMHMGKHGHRMRHGHHR